MNDSLLNVVLLLLLLVVSATMTVLVVLYSYNKRSKFYIDDQSHPQTIDVMKTRAA